MKKYIFSLIAMAFGMLNAFAQTVSVDDVTIKAGETKVVSINLNNSQSNIVSFQMDLTLPDGITINKAGCGLSSRFTDSDQELTVGRQPNGDYRLTSTSLALKPILGTSGEIVKLSLTAASDAKGGTASLGNILLATSNSESLTPANVTFNVNVPYTLTYKVDGAVYKTQEVVCGSAITPEAGPTKEGHTFSGWSELPATMPNHDVVVTGTYSVNSYFLFYVLNGEIYKTMSVQYGTAIIPETVPEKEGYTFSGWSGLPETMPAHDVTVQGQYNINSHTLTYKVEGEVYKTYTLEYHSAITPEPAPTKEGYTFSGWSDIPELMPDKDVVVTGTFSINSYTLTYLVDGKEYKTSTVDYGTALVPEAEPTKEGYTFSGWSEIPATMPAHDVTVTGTFTINKYKLTYIVDGAEYKSYEIDYGSAITPEAAPTKEGHTFSGWSEIPATMPAHDVEVTGSFSINSYTLTYKVDGEVYKTSTVVYGTALTPEAEPTKEGYTFSGWSEIPETMPARDVEVIGSFTINQYTVKFLDWDGTVIRETKQDYHSAIIVPDSPVREGYSFKGWDAEIAAVVPAHDVTYTATYTINSYTLTYKVDGMVYKTLTVVYGTVITPEAAPTKEGHTFSGWNGLPETMPAHDVEVTGTFSINSYTLTYLVDGEVYKTFTVIFGTPLAQEAEPTKEGYTFSGWSELPESMPARDVTVEGRFIINTHTLTYFVNGTIYKTYELDYHQPITPEPAPVVEGYSFSGWSEIPELMPDNDVEVTGSLTINSYTLTYLVDGEVYKKYTIIYGTALTLEEEPTKEGYTFSGWSELPKTMPAKDVTVEGQFIINTHTLTYYVNGSIYKTCELDYHQPITPEPAPVVEGYSFSGWSEIPELMPDNDVEVTGSLTINSYTLTYLVDGEVYKTFSVVYGTALTLIEEPTKEGYTFSGWSELPKTMPAKDVTVSGSFTINSYTLTYIVDGEEYKSFSVEYGTVLTPEAEPTKEGYTFSGWSEIPETMPAGDVEVTGSFSVNSYTLTYMLDGKEYKTMTVVYGTAITPEEEPTKEGYTFSGWSEIPKTMPARDVVVTGSFSINQYILAYILDGREYKSYTIDYNTAITPEPVPTKKGMTFSGWGEVPERMPAHDVTLTGSYSWSQETYDYVTYQVTDTLNNYASVVGYDEANEEVEILTAVEIGGDIYTVNSIAEGAVPQTARICVHVGKLLLWLWEAGYNNIRETDGDRELVAPEMSLIAKTASSLTMSFVNEYPELTETVMASGTPVEKGEKGYDIALKGLEPDKLYEGIATFTLTFEDATYTKSYSFSTEPLTLTTQQPKVVSLGNVIVAAESNLDDEETNVGFEWRRTDWTEDFASGKGAAYLYEGTMEGYIRNLYTEKLWKYRPYYESNAGNFYYGEWVGIDPTNTSYFEPTVHTYSSVTVTGNSAEVKGYAMQGTEDVASQGFAYWSTDNASSRRKVNGIPDNATIVLVNGYVMTATFEGLEYDTEYCCVAFITTTEGETFYGEPQIFKTNSDPDGIKKVESLTPAFSKGEGDWYDLNGRKLAAPQKGVNIIRHSDGTTRKELLK